MKAEGFGGTIAKHNKGMFKLGISYSLRCVLRLEILFSDFIYGPSFSLRVKVDYKKTNKLNQAVQISNKIKGLKRWETIQANDFLKKKIYPKAAKLLEILHSIPKK